MNLIDKSLHYQITEWESVMLNFDRIEREISFAKNEFYLFEYRFYKNEELVLTLKTPKKLKFENKSVGKYCTNFWFQLV